LEIKVLALKSPQIVINELAPEFEKQNGCKITHVLGAGDMPLHIWEKIETGENFDAAFVPPFVLDRLQKEGRTVASSRTNFLRVPIGVAVKAGAGKPDISSVAAFKQTVLDASSIAYLKAGLSGPHLDELFDRFGIANEVQAKAKRTETDTVGELVAEGDAEIGVTAIATLMATPGIDIVGQIPSDIQSYVSFVAAISTTTGVPDIAGKLIDYLTGPAAVPVFRSKGMEPW